MSATYYPVSLNLTNRRAVVIADGELAEAKVVSLLDAGARVTVVSRQATPRVKALAASGAIVHLARDYCDGDLDGAWLAISAPEGRTLNAAIWREAERRGVLLNAVDDIPHCHFIAPAIHRAGPITVAISTGGTSPALAVVLKQRAARIARPAHGEFAELLGSMRADVAARIPDVERRKELWIDAVRSPALRLIARGDRTRATAVLERIISRAERGLRQLGSDSNSKLGSDSNLSPSKGLVTLVGAGPGDPSLVTVAGLRAIRRADAIVYDRLVHRALVRAAPGARRIYAGKRPQGPSVSQERINALMLKLARRGLHVVRLKGGDPYVFGRGAEEAAVLRDAGIRVRVIPGVSSAIAAAGAAGIPVTHRDHSAGFVVVSAERAGTSRPLDWDAIARIPTIVVMMGVRQLDNVLTQLGANGLAPGTPAALVANATRVSQRAVVGCLGTVATLARDANIEPPATLIVGEVVRVASHDFSTSISALTQPA